MCTYIYPLNYRKNSANIPAPSDVYWDPYPSTHQPTMYVVLLLIHIIMLSPTRCRANCPENRKTCFGQHGNKKETGLMKGNQRLISTYFWGGTLGGSGVGWPAITVVHCWLPKEKSLMVAQKRRSIRKYQLLPKTPDPSYGNTRPSVHDTPAALKQVVLTPNDIPWSLRASSILFCQSVDGLEYFGINRLTEIDLISNMQYRNRQILKELPFPNQRFLASLQGINISHRGTGKSCLQGALVGDILVPRRVSI